MLFGGVRLPVRIAGACDAEETVAADVDPEVDLLAALGRVDVVVVVLVVVTVEDAAVGEAEDGASSFVEDEGFAAKVEVERHVGALPGLREHTGDVEPGAVPGVAPVFALLDRAVLEGEALVVGDGFRRDGDLGLQGRALADDVMLDAVVDLADAGLVDVGVEVCQGLLGDD